jgi:hypothetical protein
LLSSDQSLALGHALLGLSQPLQKNFPVHALAPSQS